MRSRGFQLPCDPHDRYNMQRVLYGRRFPVACGRTMVLRSNLYEAAFEAYLQRLRFPFLATDEARRAPDGLASLKSPDFVLQPRPGEFYVVDVKGRRFPSGKRRQQYWRNWTTREDVASLTRWEERFGEGASAWFVFAYRVLGERAPTAPEDLFAFRGELFGFVAIRLANYLAHARLLSPKWDTITMPTGTFRRLAIPVNQWLAPPSVAETGPGMTAPSSEAESQIAHR